MPKSMKEFLLRELDDCAKLRRVQLIPPAESAQLRIGANGQLKGPRIILTKLLHELKRRQ